MLGTFLNLFRKPFTSNVTIRPITEDDLELLWAWRRLLPSNATQSTTRSRGTPTWDEHLAWFRSKNHSDFIVQCGSRKVGTVGFRHKTPDLCSVSIHIADPEARGQGVATRACRLAETSAKKAGYVWIMAQVRVDNQASQKLFRSSLGFKYLGNHGEWMTYYGLL